MEAKSTRQRWTYAEFARLPSEGSTRYEVIGGELFVTPAPTVRHQRIVMRLSTLLYSFAREHGLGEVFGSPLDVLFAEGDYVEPDILFVRSGRADLLSDRGVEGAPDLVVEVLSPATAARDRGLKLERYRHHGVPEYWIVDPDERCVETWRLAQQADKPVVVGPAGTLRWQPVEHGAALEIPVAELFEEA
ncbi:MAG TPA: Uma2 family endonuclease [Longimicrobiales bacterium]|nr:Uma2 family endonuclease [Longimicrobiales bacterium]